MTTQAMSKATVAGQRSTVGRRVTLTGQLARRRLALAGALR